MIKLHANYFVNEVQKTRETKNLAALLPHFLLFSNADSTHRSVERLLVHNKIKIISSFLALRPTSLSQTIADKLVE